MSTLNLNKIKARDPHVIASNIKEIFKATEVDPESFNSWERKFANEMRIWPVTHMTANQLDEIEKLLIKARKR